MIDTDTASETAPTRFAHRPTLLMTGLAGLLFVVSIFFEGPVEPDDNASADQLRTYYSDNLAAIELQVFGEVLSALALILLAVGVGRLVRSAWSGLTTDLAVVAGALTAVWMWVQAAVDLVPAVVADDDGSFENVADSTMLSLDLVARIGETFGDVATVPRSLFVLAASIAMISSRVLPRWLGYVGVAVGTAGLLGVAGVAFGGALTIPWFVGLFGFLLWTLVLAVTCLARAVRARPRK